MQYISDTSRKYLYCPWREEWNALIDPRRFRSLPLAIRNVPLAAAEGSEVLKGASERVADLPFRAAERSETPADLPLLVVEGSGALLKVPIPVGKTPSPQRNARWSQRKSPSR